MSDHELPEEIERDIERTRDDIDRTLNDLQYRLSPNTLINKALGSARVKTTLQSAGSGTAGIAANLGRTMSSNPIPVLLTAIGLTWLAFSSSSGNGKRKRQLTDYDSDDLATRVYDEESDEVSGREDPSRGPRYEHVNDPTLRFGATPGPAKMKAHNPGTSDWGADSDPSGEVNEPLDPRTDAEVTEELKARASQRRGSRIRERARGVAASVSGRVGRVSETLSEGVERMSGVMKSSGGTYETDPGRGRSRDAGRASGANARGGCLPVRGRFHPRKSHYQRRGGGCTWRGAGVDDPVYPARAQDDWRGQRPGEGLRSRGGGGYRRARQGCRSQRYRGRGGCSAQGGDEGARDTWRGRRGYRPGREAGRALGGPYLSGDGSRDGRKGKGGMARLDCR